jgi:hypothetical protein
MQVRVVPSGGIHAVVRDSRDGTWRYRKVVKLPDGRKVRINGTPAINTKQAAEAAERAHIIRALDPESELKEVPTFEEFVDDRWWPARSGRAGGDGQAEGAGVIAAATVRDSKVETFSCRCTQIQRDRINVRRVERRIGSG